MARVSQNNRILSLDVFRGLTIILMILVNSPGTKFPYPILDHSPWNGCTLADIVFPCFLFIVGVTCVISLRKKLELKNKTRLYISILLRSVVLFVLGLMLNIFPHLLHIDSLRVYGVLQRIALCYLVCSFIYLNTTIKMQILIFLGILWGYWLVMTQISVPGHGVNQLTADGNWAAYMDQLIFSSRHLLAKTNDPEGFLSTIPSIATTLMGILTGNLLLTSLNNQKKFYLMSLAGLFCLLLGWAWNFSFPINKNLWTSSFVLWTGGCSLLVFALCFLIIDILGYKKWALPLKIFGVNALFAFTFHVILLKIQAIFVFSLKNGPANNIKGHIVESLLGSYSGPNASLIYSIGFLLLNFLVVAFLYRRKIFIRI